MGAAPPWGQSLLRSCLAAHSFPPPPPRRAIRRRKRHDTNTTPTRQTPKRLDNDTSELGAVGHYFGTWEYEQFGAERSASGEAPSSGVGAGRSAVYPEARL